MIEQEKTINLEDHRVKGPDGTIAKVFTGRDRGRDVRLESKIDDIEALAENVKFIIPNNVYSINPSFFEELFVNVIIKLGRQGFLEKFTFESQGNYNYHRPLNEAINRILREKSSLE